ncbi:MAG: cyclic nucleotide-binding domain-containing protein [Magnetospirillum sp.]|nr:cyclic nucleotide-binding domain-containing protein [Magnetospirillum sp.]
MNIDIDLSGITALIIDDSRYARSFLRSALNTCGVGTILEAADGAAGIATLDGGRVDLVLVDNDMAPVNGVEFARLVRANRTAANVDVPILMVSGLADSEHVAEARNAGVTEFLAKPVSAESLFRRIRNALTNPRAFVRTAAYAGPDRRSVDRRPPEGADRRTNPPLPKPPPLVVPARGAEAEVPPPAPPPPVDKTIRKRFRTGELIFREGESGDEAYVVEKGRVVICKETDGKRVVLGELGKHGIFGEMALIDDAPRMASAIADEDETVCLVLPKAAIRAQVQRSPQLVILVLETLLQNVRKMGRELAEARGRLGPQRRR